MFCETKRGVEAHHFGRRGMGQKAPDRQSVPLCVEHHREFHRTGTINGLPRPVLMAQFEARSQQLNHAYYRQE